MENFRGIGSLVFFFEWHFSTLLPCSFFVIKALFAEDVGLSRRQGDENKAPFSKSGPASSCSSSATPLFTSPSAGFKRVWLSFVQGRCQAQACACICRASEIVLHLVLTKE